MIRILLALTVTLASVVSPADGIEPITDKKRVIAHYMPGDLLFRGRQVPDNINPANYAPDGPAAAVGGLVQAVPMSALLRPDVSLDEAVAHELMAARLMGVDGFQFYYPFHPGPVLNKYNEVIAAFFQVAEQQFPEFRLTLCFCCTHCALDEEQAIAAWSTPIRELLQSCRESPTWLRTPDGRTLFYTWCPDGLAGSVEHHHEVIRHPERLADTATAYQRLADACGIRAAYIYHLRGHDKPDVLAAALEAFPAIWGWTTSFQPDDGWEEVAAACRRRGRTYTQTVYPDYYTSKMYRKDSGDMMHFLRDVLIQPRDQLYREMQECGVTYVYRNLLERAVKLDVPIINLVTWNDYAEGHHLAPEINHNFAFSVLLKHYKRHWLAQSGGGEWAAVFYQKYAKHIRPDPFDIPVHIKQSVGAAASEDDIEIITHLASPAQLTLNGQDLGPAPAGFHVRRIPLRPGPVRVRVTRKGQSILEVEGREAITDRPYRTDRLTVGMSSRFMEYFTALYGQVAPPGATAYRAPAEPNP